MTSKSNTDTSFMMLVGAIAVIILLTLLGAAAWTFLFNTFVIEVFLTDMAPLSLVQGGGLYLLVWFTLIGLRSR